METQIESTLIWMESKILIICCLQEYKIPFLLLSGITAANQAANPH